MANTVYNISKEDLIDKPIDYVSLNESDFEGFEVKKGLIDVPQESYLSDILTPSILELTTVSDTVVINCSVGEGKSYLANKIARTYIKKEEYKHIYGVIFVAPHKSLVKQYRNQLEKLISIKIPDYENLIESNPDEKPEEKPSKKNVNDINYNCGRPLHVVTIDCLLGNAGDAIEQSKIKRKYIENIMSFAKKHKCKIVLIFDEIHDAVDNFKPELIYNLWKFEEREILHKAFVLSATFSESSKIVVKHIARTTNNKIHIIESVRKQNAGKKLSNLHLHLIDEKYYRITDINFIDFFRDIISRHDFVNVLSYSKSLAIKLSMNDSPVRILFDERGKKINLCIAETHYKKLKKEQDFDPISFANYFHSDYNNIGTMFKTGISIKQFNSALIIILPNKIAMQNGLINKSTGIFSNGVIDVIQALARVRETSDIYLVIPTPIELIIPAPIGSNKYNYFPKIPQISILKAARDLTKKREEEREYYNYKYYTCKYDEYRYCMQKSLVEKHYRQIKKNRIHQLDKRADIPLKYLSEEEFTLEQGEKLLSSYYAIFGADLSAYALWAAFNNQFVNCKLETISHANFEELEEDIETKSIQDILMDLFLKYCINQDNLEGLELFDYQLYENIYKVMFEKKNILDKKIPIQESNEMLHRYIMAFIQKSLKGNDELNKKYHQEDSNGNVIDLPFEAEDYLLCCMSNAIQYTDEELTPHSSIELIKAYKSLYEIRELFINQLVETNSRTQKQYIYLSHVPAMSILGFTETQKILIAIKTINEQDKFFNYFRKLQNTSFSDSNRTNAFQASYNLLKNTFFNVENKIQKEPTTRARAAGRAQRLNIDYVTIKPLPTKRTGINLLYKYEYIKDENYEKKILEEMQIDEYNMPNWDDTVMMSIIENDLEINAKAQELVDEIKNEIPD